MNTAATRNTAFARYDQITSYSPDPRATVINENTRHYIWCAGETIPHPEIPGGFIRRCEVAPVLAMPVWDRIEDVPREMRVRTRADRAGNISEAMYLIPPQPIFRTVLDQYGSWGVTELTALQGWEPQQVEALDIDGVFFPAGAPHTYADIRTAIQEALRRKQSDPQRAVYQVIATDMLKAVAAAEKYDHSLVDETEGNIEKSKTNSAYSSVYGEDAERALFRLQRERKDKALIASAARSNTLMQELPNLIERMAQPQPVATPSLGADEFAAMVAKAAEAMAEKIVAAKLAEAKPVETKPVQQPLQQKK